VAGLDLAELVDRKVHDQLAEMNGQLEAGGPTRDPNR
jgi:hypothetical protein